MAENTPDSMAELLSDIEREWKALMGVVKRLTPQQMTTPDAGGWSPKDNLAHLADWMRVLMAYHMDGHPFQEVLSLPPGPKKTWDDDSVNAVLLERNRVRTSEDVLKDLNRVYMELTAKLRSGAFKELLKPRPADPQGKPLLGYVLGNTTEHFAEHRATIEKVL
jgi:hypothetical protein